MGVGYLTVWCKQRKILQLSGHINEGIHRSKQKLST